MVPAVLRGNALSTWSATAVPEAAARVVRAAARRRAARLALAAGAVFALGVLFGEQAEAADGRPSPVEEVVRVDAGGVGSVLDGLTAAGDAPAVRKPAGGAGRLADDRGPRSAARPAAETRSGRQAVARSGTPSLATPGGQVAPPRAESGARSGKRPGSLSLGEVVRGADERVVRPVVERVVQPVVEHPAPVETPLERVVRPVGQVVRGVTRELGAVTSALPAVPLPVPEQPAVVPPPVLPGLPTLPATLPGLVEPPAQLLPAPVAPAGQAPTPPSATADTPAVPVPAAHGPRPSAATPATASQATPTTPRPAHQATPAPPQAPPAPAPTGDGRSDGPLGSRTAADQGAARHADAGAVPAAHRPVPRLVPGAAAPAETPRTREHSRDVHVPPA
ncbi:hypothetical protein ACFY65_08895 [Streptomyces cellulosae]